MRNRKIYGSEVGHTLAPAVGALSVLRTTKRPRYAARVAGTVALIALGTVAVMVGVELRG